MDLALRNTAQGNLVTVLYDRAAQELPAEYAANEQQAAAWIAKRMLEISELDRKQNQTVQVLLANWLFNGDMGQLWQDHPNAYPTFRDFLNDVGSEREGNKLSPPVISDMCAIAETIVPYCEDNGIEVDGYITGAMWTRFRETIPVLRRAAEDDDLDKVNEILEAVRTTQNRQALRDQYRTRRTTAVGKGDVVAHNGLAVVAVVIPSAEIANVKAVLSRYVTFETIMSGQFRPQVADFRIITDLPIQETANEPEV
jgi:hypothetical protein